jgi:hypothetical protein
MRLPCVEEELQQQPHSSNGALLQPDGQRYIPVEGLLQPEQGVIRAQQQAADALDPGVSGPSAELGPQLVGRRVEVFWPLDQKWYVGLVEQYNRRTRRHKVLYEDGEVEHVQLDGEQYRLLPEIAAASQPAEAAAEQPLNETSAVDTAEHASAAAAMQGVPEL